MSTMSQFLGGSGGARTGDLRSFNEVVENTDGWVRNGVQADKLTDVKLYDHLNARGLTAEWVDVTAATGPIFTQPSSSNFRPSASNFSDAAGLSKLAFTGTYYLYAPSEGNGKVWYATNLAGPWAELPNSLGTGTPQNIVWVAETNTVLLVRSSVGSNAAVTKYDLTAGIANTFETVVANFTSNNSFYQIAWNNSLSKVVYVDSWTPTPVISAIALDGTNKVNFANTFAGYVVALNVSAGRTVVMHNSSNTASVVRMAASGTSDFTTTNVSTLSINPNTNNASISTNGTQIVCAYTTFSSPNYYAVYHHYNGSTWGTYSSLGINLGSQSQTVSVDAFNSRFYFFPGVSGNSYLSSTNICWFISTLGGTPTNVTSSYATTTTHDVVPVCVVGNKLLWSYRLATSGLNTNAVCFSTTDNFTNNTYEFISGTTAENGNLVGVNSTTGKLYFAYIAHRAQATSCGIIQVLSTTDYVTWAVEKIVFDTSNAWGAYSQPRVDMGRITVQGNNIYFFISAYLSSNNTYYTRLFRTTNNFSTVTISAVDEYVGGNPANGARSYSVFDGTYIYFTQAIPTFNNPNVGLTYYINRITLSSGSYTQAWATLISNTLYSNERGDLSANFRELSTPQYWPHLVLSEGVLYAAYATGNFANFPQSHTYSYAKITLAGTVTALGGTSSNDGTATYSQIDADTNFVYFTTNGFTRVSKVSGSVSRGSVFITDAQFSIPDFSNKSYRNASGAGTTITDVSGIGALYYRATALPAAVTGVAPVNNVPVARLNSQLVNTDANTKVFCSIDGSGSTRNNFIFKLSKNTLKFGVPAMTTNGTGVTQNVAYIKG